MSPESKSVKMVSLACLVIGIVGLAISVYVFAATSYEFAFKCLFLAMSLEIVVYGFNGARAANVPSNIPVFSKQASWSPLFCAVVLGDCLLNHEADDPLIVVTSVVCTVCSIVLAIVATKAAKAIKSA